MCGGGVWGVDKMEVKEINKQIPNEVLSVLLIDRTTKKNIIWATENYKKYGKGFEFDSKIKLDFVTGYNSSIIKPRSQKIKTEQKSRTKEKAEVFTPSWVCNIQNNTVDDEILGVGAFNTHDEKTKTWTTNYNKIKFEKDIYTWQEYVLSSRLEITCGEAPYLVSRYDTVTGKEILLKDRIGMLDRKLRVTNENLIKNGATKDEWFEWVKKSYQCTYGYEWQGDNLFLARQNLMLTFFEYYEDRFDELPSVEDQLEIAEIISWNIWQMDGLRFVIPMSCKNKKIETHTFFGVEVREQKCEGCTSYDKKYWFKHNGIYCKIKDWKLNNGDKNGILRFVDNLKNTGLQGDKAK